MKAAFRLASSARGFDVIGYATLHSKGDANHLMVINGKWRHLLRVVLIAMVVFAVVTKVLEAITSRVQSAGDRP